MNAKRQDIDRADHVTRASGLACWATVDPVVLAPLPAYRADLRGIGFAEGERPSRLVVQSIDDLAGASGTDLLGLYTPNPLCGVIEGLTDIAAGVGKRL